MPPKRKAAAAAAAAAAQKEDGEVTPSTENGGETAAVTPRASKRAKTTSQDAAKMPEEDLDKSQKAKGKVKGKKEPKEKEKEKEDKAATPKGKGKGKKAAAKAEEDEEDEEEEKKQKKTPAKKSPAGKKGAKEEPKDDEGGGEGVEEAAEPVVPLLPLEMPTAYNYAPSDPAHLKIVSYNLDGFQSACNNKMAAYCEAEDADVVCFQETKMNTTPIFLAQKYPHQYWSFCSVKKGYAGTAILSKVKPLSVSYGLGKKEHDEEGRTIIAEFEDFYLVNTYVPNSGQKLERLPYRATWDADLQAKLQELEKKKPFVWTGDLNVAHTEIDLSNPKTNKKTAGFTQQERDSFGKFLGLGYVDSYREMNPGVKDQYSFWGKRFQARAKNIGWRLDYFVMPKSFLEKVSQNLIRREVWGASDHVPIVLILKGLKFVRTLAA